jgi:hypothetical protein
MARRTSRSAVKITTPKKRKYRTLPAKKGTTIHYINPSLAVVVRRRARGGGIGSVGGLNATIDVCRCTKTAFVCTTNTETGYTVCKEECVAWDCETVPAPA